MNPLKFLDWMRDGGAPWRCPVVCLAFFWQLSCLAAERFVEGGFACPSGCLVISQNEGADELLRVDRLTQECTSLGLLQDANGVAAGCLETLALVPEIGEVTGRRFFSVDACVTNDPQNAYLGHLTWDTLLVDSNAITGAWQRKARPIGSGSGILNGVVTNLTVHEVAALAFDDTQPRLILYAVVRIGQGNDELPDVLVQVNTNTGALVPGVFAGGHDFLQLGPVTNGTGEVLFDVEDLTFNQAGQCYAVAGNGGEQREFVEFDPNAGGVVFQRTLETPQGAPLPYIDTLTFDPVQDNFLAVAGPQAGGLSNHLFRIRLAGAAVGTVVENAFGAGTNSVPIGEGRVTRGLACYLIAPSFVQILEGSVFVDQNQNQSLDSGDPLLDGVFVFLFEDENANGSVEVTDSFQGFVLSDTNGGYAFAVAIGSDYLVVAEASSFPSNRCLIVSNRIVAVSLPVQCGIDLLPVHLAVDPCADPSTELTASEWMVLDPDQASVKLTIQSVTNLTYTLQHSSNLLSGSFTNIPGYIARPGVGGMQMFVHTNAAPQGFYRIDAKP